LLEKAYQLLKKTQLDFVVANTTAAFGKDKNEIMIINKKGKSILRKGKKEVLANYILDTLK